MWCATPFSLKFTPRGKYLSSEMFKQIIDWCIPILRQLFIIVNEQCLLSSSSFLLESESIREMRRQCKNSD